MSMQHTPYILGQARANSEDLVQIMVNMVSDQGLHYLPLIQQFSDTSKGCKIHLFKFVDKYAK